MKTKTVIMLGTFLVASAGLTGSAEASNKHVQYREMVQATQGAVAGQTHAEMHSSKFDREKHEKSGFFTSLPETNRESAPKNYKNNN